MNFLFCCLLFTVLGYFCGRFCAHIAHILPQALLQNDSPKLFFKAQTFQETPKQGLLAITTAIFFLLAAVIQPLGLPLLFSLILFCILACCFITDFDHCILPDVFTFSLLWLGLLGSIFIKHITPTEAILGAALGYSVPWIANLFYWQFRGVEGMYPGDFKLNAGIGACLGINLLMLTVSLALTLLVLTAFFLFFIRRNRESNSILSLEMPYGCFASLATLCVYIGSNFARIQ